MREATINFRVLIAPSPPTLRLSAALQTPDSRALCGPLLHGNDTNADTVRAPLRRAETRTAGAARPKGCGKTQGVRQDPNSPNLGPCIVT